MNNYAKGLLYQTLIRRAFRSRKSKAADNAVFENALNLPTLEGIALVKSSLKAALLQFLTLEALPLENKTALDALMRDLDRATNGDALWAIVDKALELTRVVKDY
jgi:hypothetical protein